MPHIIPEIGEDSYIISEPLWVQYTFAMSLAALGIGGMFGAFHGLQSWPEDSIGTLFCAAIPLLTLPISLFLARVRMVHSVIDRKGIYVRCDWTIFRDKSFFVFVPWKNLGNSEIRVISDGGGLSKSVVLPLRVNDELWEQITNTRKVPRFLKSIVQRQQDQEGFRPYPVGNHCLDQKQVQAAIESLRPNSATALNYTGS